VERQLIDIQVSLPEVLAGSACALFIAGSPITGSVFLILSMIMGIMRAGAQMQEIKSRQENFARITQMISGVGSFVDEFLRGIVFVAAQQQGSDEDDDDDTSNYN
jgi:hypothetical protein